MWTLPKRTEQPATRSRREMAMDLARMVNCTSIEDRSPAHEALREAELNQQAEFLMKLQDMNSGFSVKWTRLNILTDIGDKADMAQSQAAKESTSVDSE
jgi:hypothetical protein